MDTQTSFTIEASHETGAFLLVGNPNVGKSVIFNRLTGKYVVVSNYPGTSVEVSRGRTRIGQHQYEVIDTPGVYGLMPLSEDGRVTRDILLETDGPVLQIIDSKNLERGFLVTLQLVEMGKRLVLDLNMDDEARAYGIHVEHDRLESTIGVPVIKTDAIRGSGLDRLRKAAAGAAQSGLRMDYGEDIEQACAALRVLLPDTVVSSRFLAISLLSGDRTMWTWLRKNYPDLRFEEMEQIVREVQNRYAEPLRQIITRIQSFKAKEIVSGVVKKKDLGISTLNGMLTLTINHEIFSVGMMLLLTFLTGFSLHAWHWYLPLAWGIYGFLLYRTRHHIIASLEKASFRRGYNWFLLCTILVFIYFVIGVFGAGLCVDFLETWVFERLLIPVTTAVITGITGNMLVREMLLDPTYGLISVALKYAFAIVFPIVTAFFILFGIMEDSGYLPRLAMIVNRFFRIIGLNGKAVLPFVLGLGCDTMATMTTRILSTRKEQVIVTLLLALGIPCSAQLGVIMGMAASLSWIMGLTIFITVLFSMLLVGYIAARILPGDASDFIQEIPPIRIPELKNILVKTWARVRWYLREAVPLFMLGTFMLFLFSKLQIMAWLENVSRPVIVHFLGLPAEATRAFIVGFLRRDYAATELFMLSRDLGLDAVQIVVGLVTITLFVPCIAHFFIIIKERGLRTALLMTAFVFGFAVLCGGLLNQVLRIPFIQHLIQQV